MTPISCFQKHSHVQLQGVIKQQNSMILIALIVIIVFSMFMFLLQVFAQILVSDLDLEATLQHALLPGTHLK